LINGCDAWMLVLQKSHSKIFDHVASLLHFPGSGMGISTADC